MFVDKKPYSVDWITYCRAHMLSDALPNCAGIFSLKNQLPTNLKKANEGWNLYLLCHGNERKIGGYPGKDLAEEMEPIIPATSKGFIHIQSCSTGAVPAEEFTKKLGVQRHNVIVKAPSKNATFTEEIGFRVLDTKKFNRNLETAYKILVAKHELNGKKVSEGAIKAKNDYKTVCKKTYDATKQFWSDFSELFKKCSLPTGAGWKGYQTTSAGCKSL
ncbi:MAG: hypothetical protein GY850_10890 [bacterium]|nr:hypothetical protein [bacterium]